MSEDSNIVKRRANCEDWDKIRVLYLKGETPSAIVAMFPSVKLNASYIDKKMKSEGLNNRRDMIHDSVISAAATNIEEQKKRVNNECIKLFKSGSEVIRKLLANCKEELINGNIPKGQARATAYNVDMLMSGVTKIQKGLRVAYGMDDQGKLYETEPEVLVVEGISEEKI